MKKTKICIVGLHKTGTTSVSIMLEKFGLQVTGPDTNLYYDYVDNNFDNIDKYLNIYDVFQDDPWYQIFEYIDKKGYDVKYIYLKRDLDSWLKSIQEFYCIDNYNSKVREHFYGSANTLKYPNLYKRKYLSHQERVFKYFKDKENFIVVDIRRSEDCIRLQNFLGFPLRFSEFPWVNKTPKTLKQKRIRKIKLFVKGYFGFNILVKNLLIRVFSHSRYIELRSQIRHKRSFLRKWKNQILNKF